MQSFDKKMMALALRQAGKAWGQTSPNPMVGAVLVKDGRVVSTGYHRGYGAPHAEAMALSKSGLSAKGADLYVTLEPCNHRGKQPPCTEMVLKSGVKKIFIGTLDPNPHVTGGGAKKLKRRGVKVIVGILEDQCRALNEYYNKQVTTGKPFILLKAAASLDGKLATHTGDSRWVTGEKARAHVHHIRNGVDAILVGRGTVNADDPALSTRLPGGKKGRDPLRVIVDTNLSLSPKARVFDSNLGGRTIVFCGPDPDGKKIKTLKTLGAEIISVPLKNGRVSLKSLTNRLGKMKVQSLLVEGGGEINSSFLVGDRLVDRVLFFYAPKIIGGTNAPTIVDGLGFKTMGKSLNMEILNTRFLGDDLLIEARPVYS